jgi:hypothetical protein
MEKKVNYINGVTPSVARKIAKFTFEDYFIDMKISDDYKSYLFFVDKNYPKDETRIWFGDYWGVNFKVILAG